jgi:hypothetical protein
MRYWLLRDIPLDEYSGFIVRLCASLSALLAASDAAAAIFRGVGMNIVCELIQARHIAVQIARIGGSEKTRDRLQYREARPA